MGRTGRDARSSLVEPLEPRMLLAQVAVVGFTTDITNTLDAYFMELDVDDSSGDVTGFVRIAGLTGPGPELAPGIDRITRSSNGGFIVTPTPPDVNFDLSFGAQFLDADGFSAGWQSGYDDDIPVTLFSSNLIVERPSDAELADLAGTWSFNTFAFDGFGLTGNALNGTLNIAGSSAVFVTTSLTGAPPIISSQAITTSQSDGQFITNSGFHFFLNADKTVLLVADMRNNDGRMSIGIATKADVDATTTTVSGDYRATITVDQVGAAQGFDPVNEFILRLRTDGTFSIYEMPEYDAGTLLENDAGTYTINGGTLTISSATNEITFTIPDNRRTLIPIRADFPGILSSPIDVAGLGTFVPGTSPFVSTEVEVALSQIDPSGNPLVFEMRDDGAWVRVDLLALTGASIDPATVTQIETFTDNVSGRLVANVIADGDLWTFFRAGAGSWTARNFSDLFGIQPIASNLTYVPDLGADVNSDADDRTTIAVFDNTGDLIFLDQTGAIDAAANPVFTMVNMSDDVLAPAGFATPGGANNIVSFVAPWNGRNVAWIDASGDVQTIWTAPALSGSWQVANLSTQTGAPPLAGGLVPFVQSWGGLNLAGLNVAGEVIVTWWAPGLTNWISTNFTVEFSGPNFAADSTTSWVFDWGGSNIAGLDADGEVVFFWWSPGLSTWQVAELTEPLAPTLPRPIGKLRGFASDTTASGPDSRGNVFGDGAAGELIYLSWEPGQSLWSIDNVTSLALTV